MYQFDVKNRKHFLINKFDRVRGHINFEKFEKSKNLIFDLSV